jgi:predicted PurR-regulated permease PerM
MKDPEVLRRPLRRSRGERRLTYALKVLLTIVLGAWVLSGALDFLGHIRSVTIIVIGAVFFTYIVHPLVRRLTGRMPMIWAIVLVYFGLALILGFGAAVVVPALANDSQSLVKSYPAIVHNAQTYVSDPANPILTRLPLSAREWLTGLPTQLGLLGEKYGGAAAARILGILLSTVSVLATVVVIPVLSVYLMLESEAILAAFMGLFPPRARPKTAAVLHDLDKVLGGFIRGQILVGALIGSAITIVLLAFRVKYAVLIGVTAGVFDIIPYVGAVVAFVPATLLALFNDGWQHAVMIAVLFVLIFQLEGHFIAPRIVSDSVGLSPLTVIVAILIGADLGGIGGMFVAVPVAAILKVVIQHSIPNYGTAARPPAPLPPAAEAGRAERAAPAKKRVAS